MTELRFHPSDFRYFYEADGVTLKPEPEEPLEELLAIHQQMITCFHEFCTRKREAEAPYRRTRIVDGHQQTYVDYDAWMAADEEGCMRWGMASFNGYNGIDMLEYDIDLKIMHLNEKETHKG